jgi:hypothetical protein
MLGARWQRTRAPERLSSERRSGAICCDRCARCGSVWRHRRRRTRRDTLEHRAGVDGGRILALCCVSVAPKPGRRVFATGDKLNADNWDQQRPPWARSPRRQYSRSRRRKRTRRTSPSHARRSRKRVGRHLSGVADRTCFRRGRSRGGLLHSMTDRDSQELSIRLVAGLLKGINEEPSTQRTSSGASTKSIPRFSMIRLFGIP